MSKYAFFIPALPTGLFRAVISYECPNDLFPTAKNKKVLPRNFFYSRRKLRKKLEALRKKQFSSSGVCDVLYLTLHPNRFVYERIFFGSFEHFITLYLELLLLVKTDDGEQLLFCKLRFLRISAATCVCIYKNCIINSASPVLKSQKMRPNKLNYESKEQQKVLLNSRQTATSPFNGHGKYNLKYSL